MAFLYFICLRKWLINRSSTRSSRKLWRVGFQLSYYREAIGLEGSKTPGAQTVAVYWVLWKRWHRICSKIDKNAGKVTNSKWLDANVGFIRYYQDKWEQTGPMAASKSSKYGCFPYAKVIQLTKEIHQRRVRRKTFSEYERDLYRERWSEFVRALTSVLGNCDNGYV